MTDLAKNAPGPVVKITLCVLSGCILLFLLHGSYADFVLSTPERTTFEGAPLMTSSDAYYYLYEAQQMIDAGPEGLTLSNVPDPTPPISYIAAKLSVLLDIPMRTVAFWLPPFLAALPLLVLAFLGRGLPAVALGAVLAAQVFAPYWFLRTRAGYFDTDCLNTFWFLCSLLFVHIFVTAAGWRRWAALAGIAVASLGGAAWWPQVRFLIPACALGAYAATVVFRSNPYERCLKGVLLAAGLAAVVLVFMGTVSWLPKEYAMLLRSIHDHVMLVLHSGSSGMPGVTVTELSGLNTFGYLRYIGGGFVPFIAGVAGIGVLAFARPRLAVCLLPLFGIGLLSLFSLRFLIFYVPIHALGIGYLTAFLVQRGQVRRWLDRPWAPILAALAVAVALVGPTATYTFRLNPLPSFDATQAAAAVRIRETTDPGTLVWAPWSRGHFLRYFTRRPVFVDGGDIDAPLIFLSSVPWAMTDTDAAADWLRFFAAKGRQGLFHPADRMNNVPRAAEFYREVFTDPEVMPALVGELDLGDPEWWKGYLASGRDVVLYLDHLMLRNAQNWYPTATWDFKKGAGQTQVVVNLLGHVDAPWVRMGMVETGRGPISFGSLLTVGGGRASRRQIVPGAENALVAVPGSDTLHWVDESFLGSLYAKLFILDPDGEPRFEKVFHDPLLGGLWKVLPAS